MNPGHIEKTLAASVVDATGCAPWAGRVKPEGYGAYGNKAAHRLAYELLVGPIPTGMTVDHICFRRDCVNPDHLRLLTHLENARNRRSRPGIVPDSECINGHKWSAANTYTRPNGRRDCRTCIRDRVRRYAARKAAA